MFTKRSKVISLSRENLDLFLCNLEITKTEPSKAHLKGSLLKHKVNHLPLNGNPLVPLAKILIPVVVDAISTFLYVKTKNEIIKILDQKGNNSTVQNILKLQKRGSFFINHPESKYTYPIPIKPEGLEVTHHSEYKDYYKNLKQFIERINLWIDEYPALLERDLLRDLGFKKEFSYEDLKRIEKASKESSSRELWALKATALWQLLLEKRSLEALKILKNIPLERESTEEERNFIHSMAHTLCAFEEIPKDPSASFPLFEILPFSLLQYSKKSKQEASFEIFLKNFLSEHIAFESLAQALCENIHFLERAEKEEALPSLYEIKQNGSILKKSKVCAGHFDLVDSCKKREAIREIAAIAIQKFDLDRSLKKPCHIYHQEKDPSSQLYPIFCEYYHYNDEANCNIYQYENKVDLVQSLAQCDTSTLFTVLDDLFKIDTNDLEFKDRSIAFRYNYNLIKIYLALQTLSLNALAENSNF